MRSLMTKAFGSGRPSPAMFVAIAALILGLGGSAIAGGGSVSKSDVKKIVKKAIKKNKVVAKGATDDNFAENADELSTTIRARGKGQLHIVGSIWALYNGGGDIDCQLRLNGDVIDFSSRSEYIPAHIDGDATCATNAVVPVKRGKQVVTLAAADGSGTLLDNANLNVLFIP